MKKIYLLLFIVTFSLNLFCQQDNVIVLDSAYHYYWDSDTNDWVNGNRSVSKYDANGNRAEAITYNWDTTTNSWVFDRRQVYSYDTNGNKTEYIRYRWDSNANNWVYFLKDVYYWSELTTSISNNITDLTYLVYPNPFTDFTTIKLIDTFQTQKIELIDIHGRTVRTINNVNSNSVTILRENLPSGIYFIKIHSDDTYVKKVIIK